MCTCTLQCHTSKVTFIKSSDDQLQSNYHYRTGRGECTGGYLCFPFWRKRRRRKNPLILFMFQTGQFPCKPSETQRVAPEVLEKCLGLQLREAVKVISRWSSSTPFNTNKRGQLSRRHSQLCVQFARSPVSGLCWACAALNLGGIWSLTLPPSLPSKYHDYLQTAPSRGSWQIQSLLICSL